MNLIERCTKIWKDEFDLPDDKINWLLNQLTPEAINNNGTITDEQIRNAKSRLLWHGLSEAILNYLIMEKMDQA